ncbi:hypothetical protein I4U23_016654 [Adineta vaga]|nr:hypothetical protein I4U23_016654 [Adineta vaga]
MYGFGCLFVHINPHPQGYYTLGEDPVIGVESGTKAEQLACLGGSTSGATPESFRSTGDSTAGLDEADIHGRPGQTTHEAQSGTVTSGNSETSDNWWLNKEEE